MSATFKVIKVDPEGSGVDFSGHLGLTVSDAQRCCQYCDVIFGMIGSCEILFVPGELSPLNMEAKKVLDEVILFLNIKRAESRYRQQRPVKIVYSDQFLNNLKRIKR